MPNIPEINIRDLSVNSVPTWAIDPPIAVPIYPPVTSQVGIPIVNMPGCVESHKDSDKNVNLSNNDPDQVKIFCDGEMPSFAPINYDNALVILKFDDTDLDYSAGLFETISSTLEQKPSAKFEIVAVSPTGGASFATKARERAAKILTQITEMGVPSERLSLTSSNSSTAQAEEVHIYIRN